MEDFKMEKYGFGDIVLGIPSEIGPRILFLAHSSSPERNMFGILPSAGVETPDGFWRLFGGHRLWTAPEAMPGSYSPDDRPVRIERDGSSVRITGVPEEQNSVQKQIEIKPAGGGAEVLHRIINIGRRPVRAACWALSVMACGGFAAAPLKPRKVDASGLLPDRRLALWPYTDLSDSRLVFDGDYIFVKQRPGISNPVKIGLSAEPHRAAYFLDGNVFVKEFYPREGVYPDYGSNVEVYSCGQFLELETLGPLEIMEPGGGIEHSELWSVKPAPGMKPEAARAEDLLGGA